MITGSLVALVTPMNSDGSISWESLENLIEFHIFNSTNGIVAVGTTGESATLNVAEHKKVIQFVVEKVNKRIPVIAGTGANSTSEAIELTQAAKDAGADAALLVTPYYNKPSQEGLYLHHKAVAEAVDLDQILYNVPGRTAVDMQSETVAKLSSIKNIVGIKDATGDLSRLDEMKALISDQAFTYYSGDDESSMEYMLAGGHGVISVTANVSPKAMYLLCDLATAGNREESERVNNLIIPIHQKMFVEANPIPVKYALQHMGLIPEGIRLPLTPLAAEFRSTVEQALVDAGVTA
jgi:4-hydroxy-tetrahydrodipicolinate synthase